MANAMNKVRTDMAQRFVDALSQGQLPWRACWRQQRPINMTTGKLYRGVNALYLSYIADELGYADPRWCTYKQAQEKGWQVRKGEKSARVEFWAYYDHKQKKIISWDEAKKCLASDPNYMENLQLSCRVYSVFNASQMDGVPELLRGTTDIGAVRAQRDTLILNMNVGYRELGDRAYYSPHKDEVTLPPEAEFDDTYSYMATLLHECGHASGHPSRLCRDMSGWHGTPEYAREELRAEIASAFTMQALGLELSEAQMEQHMKQHIAYVQSWAGVLKKNPEELFRAIKAAEEISDYLIEKGEFEMAQASTKTIAPGHTEVKSVAIESTNDYSDWDFHNEIVDLDVQNEDGTWGREVVRYRVVTISGDNRLVPMTRPLESEEAALSAVHNDPTLKLIPYDELVRQVAAQPKTSCTLTPLPDGSGLRLRIFGDGASRGVEDVADRPFQQQAAQIREVIVEDGVTYVGKNILCDLPALERVSWAATVRGYDPSALRNCPELKEILFRGGSQRRMNMRGVTSPAELLAVAPRYPQLTKEQLSEVICGLKDRLTEEQISVFAKPEFTPLQMNAIRYALKDSLPPEAIRLIADPGFDSVQMDIIRSGFTAGMTMDQVRSFAKHGLTSQQMMDTYLEIQNANAAEAEFWEMTEFLNKGGDIAELADWYEKDLDIEP